MRVPLTITLIPLILWLAGCAASGRSGAAPPGSWVRTVDWSCEYERTVVWNAIVTAATEYHFKRRDPSVGMVITDWKTTIIPHDFMYAPPIRIHYKDSLNPGILVPPKEIHINFQVKRRFLISMTDTPSGRILVTITRQMEASYFDGPRGGMVEEVMQNVRYMFDTEEEIDSLLHKIQHMALKGAETVR